MFKSIGNGELLSKKISTEIENAIITHKLEVGYKFPSELELCKQFGVSRTAVREALSMLNAKGLISVEKGRGIFVAKMSSKNVTDPMRNYLFNRVGVSSIVEIINARLIIEPEFARIAAINHNDEDIKTLEEDLEKLLSYQEDPKILASYDMNFHIDIAKATRNNLLPLVLQPIFKLMPDIKEKILSDVPEAHDSATVWHKKIFNAIKNRQSVEAYEVMQMHLTIAREHAEKMLKIEGLLQNEEKINGGKKSEG